MIMDCRGAVRGRGLAKRTNAVGPSAGYMSGMFMSHASAPIVTIANAALIAETAETTALSSARASKVGMEQYARQTVSRCRTLFTCLRPPRRQGILP